MDGITSWISIKKYRWGSAQYANYLVRRYYPLFIDKVNGSEGVSLPILFGYRHLKDLSIPNSVGLG